jgi:hypothetical protein
VAGSAKELHLNQYVVFVADGQHRGVTVNNPTPQEKRKYGGWCRYSAARGRGRPANNTSLRYVQRHGQGTGGSTKRCPGQGERHTKVKVSLFLKAYWGSGGIARH